jgi:hypothetical protein
LDAFITSHAAQLKKGLSSPNFEQFLKQLNVEEAQLTARFKTPDSYVKSLYAWYRKYHAEFKKGMESNQGEDKNACLGEGVCAGLAYNAAMMALQSPDAEMDAVITRAIHPEDRVVQAMHSMNVRTGSSKSLLFPASMLKKDNVKEKTLLTVRAQEDPTTHKLNREDLDLNVFSALVEVLPNAQRSNGGLVLSWGKHATFVRFDTKRNKYCFFDPNFGTLVFTPKDKETKEQLAIRMATAYIELYKCSYSGRKDFQVRQFVPIS